MLDYICHMRLNIFSSGILGVKTPRFFRILRNFIMDLIALRY